MTRLLEDIVSDEERLAIELVLKSREIRFDKLTVLAGLDPASDFTRSDLRALNFCGADLRGFNFTGSDLRDIAIDGNTQIDDTTILKDANVRWVTKEDIPIVELMMGVVSASNHASRSSLLADIEMRFGKTDHVIKFVVNAASETGDLDTFLDFLEFLPPNLSEPNIRKIAKNGARVLRGKFAKSRSRTRRQKTAIFASSSIIEKLQKAEDSMSSVWLKRIAIVADIHAQTHALKGTVELTDQILLKALNDLPKSASETN